MKQVSLVAALNRVRAIGRDNKLLWRLPRDLRHFKDVTFGKPVVMGHNTYESLGRPLPGRANIVLSRRPSLALAGCTVVGSLEEAIDAAGDVEEVMVIGGAQVYEQAMSMATRLYLTHVDNDLAGDAHFPQLGSEWREMQAEHHPADEKNPFACRFVYYERVREATEET